MIEQTKLNENIYPYVQAACFFSCDQNDPVPDYGEVEPARDFRPGKKFEARSSQAAGPYQALSEIPLWPSVSVIRSAMEKDCSRRKGVEQALKLRSVSICAVLLSMMTFGLILAV